MSMTTDARVIIARGNLLGTGGAQAAPASGATITILDTTVGNSWGASSDRVPFHRIQLNIYSSHDSGTNGVVFSSSFDRGTNFRSQSATTYTQATDLARSWDYLMRGGHLKIQYTNSSNGLTAWEMEVVGIYDRNPGS